MKNEEILKKIKSIILCLMAHPDNEPDSEFADRIDDLIEIQNELSERQATLDSQTQDKGEALNLGVVIGCLLLILF